MINNDTAVLAYRVANSNKYSKDDPAKLLANHVLTDYDPQFFLKTESQRRRVLGLSPIASVSDVKSPTKT